MEVAMRMVQMQVQVHARAKFPSQSSMFSRLGKRHLLVAPRQKDKSCGIDTYRPVCNF